MRGSGITTSTRRLLLLSTAANIGGMERIVCGLAREFTRSGWQVQTLFPHTSNSQALLRWCHEQGVAAETHPGVLDAAVPHTTKDIARLRQLIRERAPHVVNIHYGDNFVSLKDVLAIRSAGRQKLVVSVHHPTSWADTSFKKRILTRLAAGLAHDVTVFSHATRQILYEAGVPRSNVHLIPCGLRVPEPGLSQSEARLRLGLPAAGLIIGCLARLVAHKRIDDLIAAVAALPQPTTDLRLVVAGDGPERAALEQLAAERLGGRAIFLGRVGDVDEFLAACDVFALPSQLEGFGLVYVEAAFHGVPSVATEVGGIPDAVIDGETGLLVPVGDRAALCQALQRLSEDAALRRRLGQAARVRAHTELTETAMASRFTQVFCG